MNQAQPLHIQAVLFDFYGVLFNPSLRDIQPGAKEYIQQLQRAGIPCGIVSSSGREYIGEFLQQHDLGDYFKVVITGDMVEYTKPHPDGWLRAADFLYFAPNFCVVIDDNADVVEQAARVGFHAYQFGKTIVDFTELPVPLDKSSNTL